MPSKNTPAEVVEESRSVVSTRVPGAAVLTAADAKITAQEAKEAKTRVDTQVNPSSHPLENQGIPGVVTHNVSANVAGRSNIVADGPGTCASIIREEGNDPSAPEYH